ncbi:MAG: AI-2E family transporter [Candidatus Eremiobacteraeota bacterium]|nr:AI-2E family transporter [Candidatus Eremiobacteraeota bacterium]
MADRPTERKRLSVLQVLATIALGALLIYGVATFFGRLQGTVIIVIASTFFAYLTYPLVRYLARQMPVILAIVLIYLALLAAIGLVVTLLVPPLLTDASLFIRGLPRLISTLSAEIADPTNKLFAWMPPGLRGYVATLPQQLLLALQHYGFTAAQQVATYLFSVVSIIATVVVVPVLTAYMILDSENLLRTFLGLFPERGRPKAKAVLADLDRVLGGFIRGQLIDCVIVGVLIFIMLTILRVPYAYLIAVVAGVLNFVPYLGAIVGFIPSVILALVYNGPTNALIVGLSFAAIQQLDGNVIVPRIMRESVGLSPVWIILSIIAFSELFGLVGTFVAVPVAAMLRVLKMHFLPDPVEPHEAKPSPADEALRLDEEEIASVER